MSAPLALRSAPLPPAPAGTPQPEQVQGLEGPALAHLPVAHRAPSPPAGALLEEQLFTEAVRALAPAVPHGAEATARRPLTGHVLPVDYAGPFKERKEALVRLFEREYLLRLLSQCRGNVALAARTAGLDRKHLYSLMSKHALVQGRASGQEDT
jgi:hypothetical protein